MGKAVLEGNEIGGCSGSSERLTEEEVRDGGEVREGRVRVMSGKRARVLVSSSWMPGAPHSGAATVIRQWKSRRSSRGQGRGARQLQLRKN